MENEKYSIATIKTDVVIEKSVAEKGPKEIADWIIGKDENFVRGLIEKATITTKPFTGYFKVYSIDDNNNEREIRSETLPQSLVAAETLFNGNPYGNNQDTMAYVVKKADVDGSLKPFVLYYLSNEFKTKYDDCEYISKYSIYYDDVMEEWYKTLLQEGAKAEETTTKEYFVKKAEWDITKREFTSGKTLIDAISESGLLATKVKVREWINENYVKGCKNGICYYFEIWERSTTRNGKVSEKMVWTIWGTRESHLHSYVGEGVTSNGETYEPSEVYRIYLEGITRKKIDENRKLLSVVWNKNNSPMRDKYGSFIKKVTYAVVSYGESVVNVYIETKKEGRMHHCDIKLLEHLDPKWEEVLREHLKESYLKGKKK